jgi:virulence-associated protein VagC
MQKIAQILFENGQQIIRLPEDIHLSATQMDIRHDEHSGQITLTPRDERTEGESQQNWDNFSKIAAEIPQEEWDLFDASLKAARTCPKCGA